MFCFQKCFLICHIVLQKWSVFISVYSGNSCMNLFFPSSHIQGSYLISQPLQPTHIEVFTISKIQSPQPVRMTYFLGSWTSYFLLFNWASLLIGSRSLWRNDLLFTTLLDFLSYLILVISIWIFSSRSSIIMCYNTEPKIDCWATEEKQPHWMLVPYSPLL